MPSQCGVGEDSWEFLGQQGCQPSQSKGRSTLNIHWKDWCWSWSSYILVTWLKQPTRWKSVQCWDRLKAEGGEGVLGRGGWMMSLMQCTWSRTNFGRWWGQGGLACCSPWGHKESDITGQLNNDMYVYYWISLLCTWHVISQLSFTRKTLKRNQSEMPII